MTAIGLGLILSVAGCGGGGQNPPGEPFDAGPFFATSTPQVAHQFLVTNTTGRTVRILDEIHSCNCTKVVVDKGELPPGASIPLLLSVQVPPAYAKIDVSSTLKTDHPTHPRWTYRLRFESYPEARIVPDRIDLGPYTVGDEGDPEGPPEDLAPESWLEVYAHPAKGDPPAPGSIQSPEECSVSLGREPQLETLIGGVRRARYRLSVKLKEESRRSPGTFARPLNVSIPGGAAASALIGWTVRAPIACVPAQVHFGMITPGEPPTTQKVLLRSADGQPFRILSIDGGPFLEVESLQGAEVPPTPTEAHLLSLSLEVPGNATSRSLVGSARIKTDRSDYPEVRLPWSAFLRDQSGQSPRGVASQVANPQPQPERRLP